MSSLYFSAHWYLAVICFPGLREPVHDPEPGPDINGTTQVAEGSDNKPTEGTAPDQAKPEVRNS